MSDKDKVTQEGETIPTSVETPKEGTVEAEIAKTETPPKKEGQEGEEAPKEPQTVPLSVYLSLKDDLKELRREIKESKNSDKPKVTIEGVKDLAAKYPQVSEEFITDILESATATAQKKIDEKYTPIIESQKQKEAKEAFDKAFDKVYDKAIKDNPDLPKNIDKEAVKALALSPAYRNTPVGEILTKLYGGLDTGKATTENDTRTAGDTGDEVIDFEKMSAEQKDRVLSDPKARKKYFDWLDTK